MARTICAHMNRECAGNGSRSDPGAAAAAQPRRAFGWLSMRPRALVAGLWDFLASIPSEQRTAAMAQLIDDIERLYREHGQPAPAFIHMARESLRTGCGS